MVTERCPPPSRCVQPSTPQQKAWSGVDTGATVRVGTTSWTVAGNVWMAHTSRVPFPTHKHVEPPSGGVRKVQVSAAIARLTVDARPVERARGSWVNRSDNVPVVAMAPPSQHPISAAWAVRLPILAGFRAAFFDGLNAMCDGCEVRLDPWRVALSWWSPRGWPVAILLGYSQRPVPA